MNERQMRAIADGFDLSRPFIQHARRVTEKIETLNPRIALRGARCLRRNSRIQGNRRSAVHVGTCVHSYRPNTRDSPFHITLKARAYVVVGRPENRFRVLRVIT